MGLRSSILGALSRIGHPRHVTLDAFQANLKRQKKMTPKTIAELRKYGVGENKSLKLEFFFYTNAEAKGQGLAKSLKRLQYEAATRAAGGDSKLFVVKGWSTPVKMTDEGVIAWTEKMCRLGFEYDCAFDGWGTSPPQ